MVSYFARIAFLGSCVCLFSRFPSFGATSMESDFSEIRGFCKAKHIDFDELGFSNLRLNEERVVIIHKGREDLRRFIDEKANRFPPHDFFSIDRFSGEVPHEKDEELINNWKGWHFCKSLVASLDGRNAKKELDLTLESKKEFYENIAFMTTDPEIGLKAKDFYRQQLIAVNQLPEE